MKNKLLYILLVGFGMVYLSSCSMSFEKRRYRPGYHIEVIKNLPPRESKDERGGMKTIAPPIAKVVNVKSVLPLTYPVNLVELPQEKTDTSIEWKRNSIESKPTKSQAFQLVFMNHTNKTAAARHIFEIKKVQTAKGRKIIAWVFGGISIALVIGAIILAFTSWILFVPAGIMLAIAIGLAISALVVRFTGPKEETDTVKPLKSGFVKGIFIFSIVTLGVALGALIVSLLIHPLVFIGWLVAILGFILSIITISLGFSALDRDISLKTKLTIIFGFIALILLVIALIFAIIV